MYGGSNSRNLVNVHVKNLPAEWSIEEGSTKNIKWVAELGSKSYGGPIIVGGKVYVGTNNQRPRDPKFRDAKGKPIDLGILMCFGVERGDFQWQIPFGKLSSGQVNDWPYEGLCSSPVVEGDRLYFTNNRCEVRCADTSGKFIWKLDMIKDLGVFPHNITDCSPLIAGDKLFVITANGVNEDHINVPAPKAPSFLCLSKADGKVVWQKNDPSANLLKAPGKGNEKAFIKQLVNRGELLQHGQWSNPAYAVVNGKPQVIFPGGDGWVYAFEPDTGKLIWKFDGNPKDAVYKLGGEGTRSDYIATPVIYDNKVYIGLGQDPEHEQGVGHLWCIDMTKKGDVSPEVVTDDTVFPPKTKANPNSAAVWHYGGPADPKLGRNYNFGRTMSTCAIHDSLLYVADLEGYLHCLDAKTGRPYWVHETGAFTWSSPYWVDGKVYLGTEGKSVFVFAHGKEKKLLAENEMDARVRATPVAANGTLYVMTENKLYAIAAK
jgi:outer membrane protein assembly factor BamB